jgi:actin-related protein
MGTLIIVGIIVFVIAVVIFKNISKSTVKKQKSIEIKTMARKINEGFLREQEEKRAKAKERAKNRTKTTGKFDVMGYKFLPDNARKIIRKDLKVGDEVKLITDPKNKYDDHAIKVMFNDVQIGWFAAKGYRQKEIFDQLTNGKDIKVMILINTGSGGYIRAQFEYNI